MQTHNTRPDFHLASWLDDHVHPCAYFSPSDRLEVAALAAQLEADAACHGRTRRQLGTEADDTLEGIIRTHWDRTIDLQVAGYVADSRA